MLKKLITSILTFVLSVSFVPMAFAASGNITTINENYSRQFMLNWCWVATGVNAFIGFTGEFYDADESEQKELLYTQAKQCVDSVSELRPNTNYDNKYEKYDIGGGLTYTCMIINNLISEYGYEYKDVDYRCNSSKTVRSFSWIEDDIEEGYPMGIYLNHKNSISNYDHIVLINGTDTIFDDSKDYEVRIFEPDAGKNIWVNYEDLVNGDCKEVKYRKYENTAEAYY